MAHLLDTDVVIHLRDGDEWVEQQVRLLDPPLAISVITRIALENGIWREPEWADVRRNALDRILPSITTLDFERHEVAAYRAILDKVGFSRRKTADRITAATALVHDLSLVTFNGRDFHDVLDLRLVEWRQPGV